MNLAITDSKRLIDNTYYCKEKKFSIEDQELSKRMELFTLMNCMCFGILIQLITWESREFNNLKLGLVFLERYSFLYESFFKEKIILCKESK